MALKEDDPDKKPSEYREMLKIAGIVLAALLVLGLAIAYLLARGLDPSDGA